MPNTTFSQNNGLILLTGVAARKVGYAVAAILCMLGMFPKLAALLSIMPRPVLGGATIVLFGMIVVGGIRVVNQAGLTARNSIIFVVALALGLGVEYVPSVLQELPETVRNVLSSGLSTGALAGILLNLALPEDRPPQELHQPPRPEHQS
jgi:xanthine permease XanP